MTTTVLRPDVSLRLDQLDEMNDWGFTATSCTACGKPNSEISGTLIQCAKCKLAHYCGMKCFNADLQRHAQFCKSGKMDARRRMPSEGSVGATSRPVRKEEVKQRTCMPVTTPKPKVIKPKPPVVEHEEVEESESTFKLEILQVDSEDEEEEEEELPDGAKHVIVLHVEEEAIDEDDEEHYPFFLYLDKDEIDEDQMVVWLLEEDDDDGNEEKANFTVLLADADEEVEIVRKRRGSVAIGLGELPEGDDYDEFDDPSESYLTMDLPQGHVPEPKGPQQEAIHLNHVEINGKQKDYKSTSPAWSSRLSSLRRVNSDLTASALKKKGSRPSLAQAPSWLSSLSLRKVISDDPVSLTTKSSRSKEGWKQPEWAGKKQLRKTGLWDAPEGSPAAGPLAADPLLLKRRLYRRVSRSEQNQSLFASNVPLSVRRECVLFKRENVKPIGRRWVVPPKSVLSEPAQEVPMAKKAPPTKKPSQKARLIPEKKRSGGPYTRTSSTPLVRSAPDLDPPVKAPTARAPSTSQVPSWVLNSQLKSTKKTVNGADRSATIEALVSPKALPVKKVGRNWNLKPAAAPPAAPTSSGMTTDEETAPETPKTPSISLEDNNRKQLEERCNNSLSDLSEIKATSIVTPTATPKKKVTAGPPVTPPKKTKPGPVQGPASPAQEIKARKDMVEKEKTSYVVDF